LPRDLKGDAFAWLQFMATFARWPQEPGSQSPLLFETGLGLDDDVFYWPSPLDQKFPAERSLYLHYEARKSIMASLTRLPLLDGFALGERFVVISCWFFATFVSVYSYIRGNMYSIYLMPICHGRRMVMTGNGHIGLAPPHTQIGDQIYLFQGGTTPVNGARTQS
jgi:hypothetical protein